MTPEYFDTLSARSMMKIPHRDKQFLSHVLVSNKNVSGRNKIVSFKRHSLPPAPPAVVIFIPFLYLPRSLSTNVFLLPSTRGIRPAEETDQAQGPQRQYV